MVAPTITRSPFPWGRSRGPAPTALPQRPWNGSNHPFSEVQPIRLSPSPFSVPVVGRPWNFPAFNSRHVSPLLCDFIALFVLPQRLLPCAKVHSTPCLTAQNKTSTLPAVGVPPPSSIGSIMILPDMATKSFPSFTRRTHIPERALSASMRRRKIFLVLGGVDAGTVAPLDFFWPRSS